MDIRVLKLLDDDSTLLSSGRQKKDQCTKMKNACAGRADHVQQACETIAK